MRARGALALSLAACARCAGGAALAAAGLASFVPGVFAADAHGPVAHRLSGRWRGEWVREGARLPVTFDFFTAAGRDTGTFDSEPLRVIGIPLSRVQEQAGHVHFEIVGDFTTATFEGELRGRSITGAFDDNGARGTFHLERAQGATAPPYATQEVRFEHAGATLAGSLLVPRSPGPHPAIVFVHGSGPEGRYASRFLADRFARAGVAALIYDKRGVGASGGDWRHADFDTLAGDAAAAVHLLARDPRIRPDAIGIHGHSQGGTIAPLVAARAGHVAFVIASGGSGTSMVESERWSLTHFVSERDSNRADSVEAARYIDLVTRVAYAGAPYAALDSAVAVDSTRRWFFRVPGRDDPYWTFSRAIASYDPLTWWARVRVPVLLVYGAADARTPVLRSVAAITHALRSAGNADLTVRVFPGADHTFRLPSPRGGTFAWPRTAPGYPQALIDWTLAHARGRARSTRR